MNEVRIRPARISDLARMVEIEIAAATRFPMEVLPEEVGRSGSEEEIRRSIRASLAWLAETRTSGQVGFLAAKAIGFSMHIVEMDVLPSHSRQGIGGKLVEQAIEQAGTLGYREITLTTFLHIPWNAPFYARHGFQIVEGVNRHPHLVQALHQEAARGLQYRVAMSRNAA